MAKQSQGSFDRHLGDLSEGASQSGSGQKYKRINFRKEVFNTEIHLKPGQRYYDFEEQCWKIKN